MEHKYNRIMDAFRSDIESGVIRPGEKLPSIRELTARFACSKNTAIRAYEGLEKEHLVYSVAKSGYYAVVRPASSRGADAGKGIDFSSAAPDPAVMPYEDFRHCMNRAIELYKDRLFTYSDPQGFGSLRQALRRHLADGQVFAGPEQISVVSGSQQALHLLAGMPFPNGKQVVLVEQPTYPGMLRSLELLGVTVIGIARTDQGIDLEELERHFRSNPIKFFYTVPRFHNPLGTSYSQTEKERIAQLAAAYDVYIVEDDYIADLETDHRADPIYSYSDTGHVIYVKSFSKVMLPGLRLAVAVLPKALIETFRLFKASTDSSTAALSQAALELYLNCGMYGRHALNMQARYRSRMEALNSACKRHLPEEARIHVPKAGLFSRLLLPGCLPASDIGAQLKQQGIFTVPTDRCYLPAFPKDNGLRVSIIRTNESQIEEGIERIGRVVRKRLRHKPPLKWDPVIDWLE
ncbi:PLP-dependent aminotransferase family protein [Paenibacillus allorhizosphaerae]|uniref:Histidinol-phosphate aminotransferase n=1 Tax=Paenibacillus allorhizosphaerae TaxID=2849866 RepID=A0ABN7TWN5_9BACL|nr:PLP-dependent aminotransferase family protein [Paenibacillus allorhizosphaerae]CAG7653559.1 Histidinol-phosphate aminotransferase [Paenibacillus allorhizosphaerae]